MQPTARETWLTTSQAAELEGISRQAAHSRAKTGTWTVKTERAGRGGNGGQRYLIALSSLSVVARQRWYERYAQEAERAAGAGPVPAPAEEPESPNQPKSVPAPAEEPESQNRPEPVTAPASPAARPVNLAEVKALVGEVRFQQLLEAAEIKAEAVRGLLAVDIRGQKKRAAVEIAARHGVTWQTVYRWTDTYQEAGMVGLMEAPPRLHVGTVRRSVPAEVEEYAWVTHLRRDRPGRGTLKVSKVYDKCVKFCDQQGIKAPSRATIYRLIGEKREEDPGLICLIEEGEEEYNKRFAEKVIRKEPDFVNQVWMGDHRRMDFFIIYNGRPVRPWLTSWMDVCSRVIVGWSLSIQANGRTIALALRHGIWHKRLPCWDREVSPALRLHLDSLDWDWDEISGYAGQELPFSGLPSVLYIDNGEDYKARLKKGTAHPGFEYSREVRGTCESLGIKPQFCTKYSPWGKAHMERWYGTLAKQFDRDLPSYCGKDNKQRPHDLDEKQMAARGELLDIEESAFLLEMYLHRYHNAVHSTLGMTPIQKYESTPKARAGVPELRALDICLMDVEKATVSASGIQRFGIRGRPRYYKHELLMDKYVGRKVVIRYDPNRLGEIRVFDPKTGREICTATNAELLSWEASKDDIAAIRKANAARKKDLKRRLKESGKQSVEAVARARQAAGPAMTSGEIDGDKKPGTRYITGFEQAARAKEKEDKRLPAGEAKATRKKAAGSRFDDFLRKAGSEI